MSLLSYDNLTTMFDNANVKWSEIPAVTGGWRLAVGDRLFDISDQEKSFGLSPHKAEQIIEAVEEMKGTERNMTAAECKDVRTMLDGWQKTWGNDGADLEEAAVHLIAAISAFVISKDKRLLVDASAAFTDIFASTNNKMSEAFIKSAMERT